LGNDGTGDGGILGGGSLDDGAPTVGRDRAGGRVPPDGTFLAEVLLSNDTTGGNGVVVDGGFADDVPTGGRLADDETSLAGGPLSNDSSADDEGVVDDDDAVNKGGARNDCVPPIASGPVRL
jgi:hypothetical protein